MDALWHRRQPRLWMIGSAILAGGLALSILPVPWLAAGIPALILAVLILVRPHIALHAIAFAIPFGSLFEVQIGGISVGVTELLVGLMLVAWVARTIAVRESWGTWPKLSVLLALFIGATLFSLLNATSLPLAAKEIIKWVEVFAVFAFVASAVPARASRGIVASLLLAGVAQSLLGAYQFFSQTGPEFFVLRDRYMRAYGTFDQPNPYAGYLGLLAPVALALALGLFEGGNVARGEQRFGLLARVRRDWLNWLALISLVAITVGIGMSWSRGAWLGLAASLTTVVVLGNRRGAVLAGIAVLVVATVGLLASVRVVPEPVIQRLTSFVPFVGVQDIRAIEITDANYASLERLAHWQSALDMWRDHPWVGVGFGNYDAAYAEYALPKWPLALGHAHNYYLNIAAETGTIGLVAYIALWGAALWHTWQAMARARSAYHRALALGALGMLVHVTLHNVVDSLWVHNMYLQVAIVLGLVQQTVPAGSTRRTPIGVHP